MAAEAMIVAGRRWEGRPGSLLRAFPIFLSLFIEGNGITGEQPVPCGWWLRWCGGELAAMDGPDQIIERTV
jgi:hypothetical protein